MAIESKAIEEIINSDGEVEAKVEKLLALHKEGVETEVNAIKLNREAIKNEKTELHGKYVALNEQFEAMKQENAKLSKQLKDASPEEMSKLFDQKLADAAVVYEKKLADSKELEDKLKQQVATLEREHLKLECMEEFQKEAQEKNIAPDAFTDFANYVLGVNCSKFDYRPIGDGKSILATKDGMTIKQSIEAGLQTSFGKRCVAVNSSGGGAEGGTYGKTPASQNPFITKNYTQQAILKATDPAKYERLRAEAETAAHRSR